MLEILAAVCMIFRTIPNVKPTLRALSEGWNHLARRFNKQEDDDLLECYPAQVEFSYYDRI